MLADYLKTASKMCYGLSRHQAKKLAFDYAMANGICPDKWKELKNAQRIYEETQGFNCEKT